MTLPEKPTPPDPLPPEERMHQLKSQIGAEQSIAQAKKVMLRLLIGGLIAGAIASVGVVKLLALLDRAFNTNFSPPRSSEVQQR